MAGQFSLKLRMSALHSFSDEGAGQFFADVAKGRADWGRSGVQKSLTGEGFSGCGLEIALKIDSCAFGFKSTIPGQSPRCAGFGRIVTALIVDFQALF